MTDTTAKLRSTPIHTLFISYLIPSVIGMLLMAVNIVVDGIFIGQALGPIGLASANIAQPVYSIFFSISLMIGIGGATRYSIALGKKDIPHAQSIFSNAMIFSTTLILVIASLCLWQIEKLAVFFGANNKLMPYVTDYLSVLLVFGVFLVVENVLSAFIRNDGNPNLAMAGLVITSVLNIIFNYIFMFVFHWGIIGAAYATVLAAFIGLLVLFLHFKRPHRTLRFLFTKMNPKTIYTIMVTGFPSFISEVSIAVIILGYNLAFMQYVGEIGVAAFAVVNYIHTMILLIFVGVGAALQPISSFHFGSELWSRLSSSLRFAVKVAWGIGLCSLAVGYFGADLLVSIFGIKSGENASFTSHGLQIFFLSYLFMGYNMLYAEYFQSIGQIAKSVFIMLCESLLFVLPLLWLLPIWWGVNGIWFAMPIAKLLTSMIVFLMNRKKHPVFGYR